jgi:hypothetical protein
MPNVNDLKSSRFLTKYDVEPPVAVTIQRYEEMNVAMESQAPEMKYVLYFKELEKPLVLNSTNGQLIQAITGSGDFDNWTGRSIVLYNDQTISFGGKITGGIRVQAPKSGVPDPHPDIVDKPITNPDYVGDDPPPPPDDEIPY